MSGCCLPVPSTRRRSRNRHRHTNTPLSRKRPTAPKSEAAGTFICRAANCPIWPARPLPPGRKTMDELPQTATFLSTVNWKIPAKEKIPAGCCRDYTGDAAPEQETVAGVSTGWQAFENSDRTPASTGLNGPACRPGPHWQPPDDSSVGSISLSAAAHPPSSVVITTVALPGEAF
jgi:hypothetical protein